MYNTVCYCDLCVSMCVCYDLICTLCICSVFRYVMSVIVIYTDISKFAVISESIVLMGNVYISAQICLKM